MSARRKTLALLIACLALIAFGISAYLTWTIWQADAVAGCTGDSLLDCGDVLASRWSKWLGLPVSLFGTLIYLTIFGLSWPAALRPQGFAMAALFSFALLADGAAAWFIGIQAIELQSFCFYCLTVHCCGMVIGVLTLLLFLDRSSVNNYDQMRNLLGVAAEQEEDSDEVAEGLSIKNLVGALLVSSAGLVVLIGGQLLFTPAETAVMEEVEFEPLVIEEPKEPLVEEPVEEEHSTAGSDESDADDLFEDGPDSLSATELTQSRSYTIKALPEPVDLASVPMVGSPDAKHVMVEMMDYTCKHCRAVHPHIKAALERYGDQLGVVIHHVPLSKKCNSHIPLAKDRPGTKYACDYAQLAIGVWNIAPEKFPEYHNWLLEGEKPPSPTIARQRALRLVGEAVLLDKKIKADTTKRIAKQVTTFKRLKSGLPILLFSNSALKGVPEKSEKLFEYMETKLGIQSQE